MFQVTVLKPRMEDLLWMYRHASANEEVFRNILSECVIKKRLVLDYNESTLRNIRRSPLSNLFDWYVNIEGREVKQIEFYVLGSLKQTHFKCPYQEDDKALITIAKLGRGYHYEYKINQNNSVSEISESLAWMS